MCMYLFIYIFLLCYVCTTILYYAKHNGMIILGGGLVNHICNGMLFIYYVYICIHNGMYLYTVFCMYILYYKYVFISQTSICNGMYILYSVLYVIYMFMYYI